MKKLFKLLLITLFIGSTAVACAPKVTEPTVIEELVVLFVPSRDPGQILGAVAPLRELLIRELATAGFTVNSVRIEVSTDYNAAGEALAAGTAHIGFLPGGTYVAYSEEGVEVVLAATRAGLNKDSIIAKDWNDGKPTLGDPEYQVTYYRSLIYAGPTAIGQAIAAKVNAGTALTWEDVNAAKWCVASSPTSSAGYVYPTMWLMDNFNKKITDLTQPVIPGSYAVIAQNLAVGQCDIGVGYADIRRDYENQWKADWGRTVDIWNEMPVIGVTDGIFNDTISVSLNHTDMSDALKVAIANAFIAIAADPVGAEAIKIYNHEGYKVVTDADYDGARKARDIVAGK
jgi:phosphonate transport system substrate-binding protein